MAFTRYNYDDLRNVKKLQESTDPCRYILNVPGPAHTTCFYSDPQLMIQKFGANNNYVENGHPIDIDSDLKNINRQLKKFCNNAYPKNAVKSKKINYKEFNQGIRQQSRVTHPAREYRSLEQSLIHPVLLNPQENVALHFENNINTRLLERDNHKPILPCLK